MAKEPRQELVKNDAVSTDLVRPDFIEANDTRGTEGISREDIQMPRLALAQQMSPQINPAEPTFIDGLKVGDLFNDLTSEVYGKGPLDIVIIRADPPRYVEFNPRSQGGGVKDPNVDPTDPRTQWGPNGETPIATKFYDFIIMLLPAREMIVLSLKSTGLKTAKQLNALVKMRNAPIFAGKYVVTTAMAKNQKGTFAVYQVKNAGWVDRGLYGYASMAYESLRDKIIDVHRDETEETGDTSFNPNEMEQPAGSER